MMNTSSGVGRMLVREGQKRAQFLLIEDTTEHHLAYFIISCAGLIVCVPFPFRVFISTFSNSCCVDACVCVLFAFGGGLVNKGHG